MENSLLAFEEYFEKLGKTDSKNSKSPNRSTQIYSTLLQGVLSPDGWVFLFSLWNWGKISSKVQEAESWQAFLIHTTDNIMACMLRDNSSSFCAVSWDVEGTCRGDGKGVCCDRQSKVEWRDNCLRWALSRQMRQREPIITLWCCVLSSPCIQNVPYSKPSQIRMWNSAECLQLEAELTFICTQLAFSIQEWGFIPAQSFIFLISFLITFPVSGHKQKHLSVWEQG